MCTCLMMRCRRRDETGLVLAVFRRLDFSLQWLKTYDTHRNRTEALQMAEHIRFYNASYFVGASQRGAELC